MKHMQYIIFVSFLLLGVSCGTSSNEKNEAREKAIRDSIMLDSLRTIKQQIELEIKEIEETSTAIDTAAKNLDDALKGLE